MKIPQNYIILFLCILLVYFIFSGNKNEVSQVKIDALENEKHQAIEKLFTLTKKTKADSLNFIEHLRQDSVNSIDVERLETSLAKSRQDYKEAVSRFKDVFSYRQEKLDSIFQKLYPQPDNQ